MDIEMFVSEKDINFSSISDALFEELCFDLLVRLGFQSLSWRRGPADEGRDIEGLFRSVNPLIGEYEERWFFECKNYSGGVDKSALSSATEWADVNEPDHLVLMVSPHVTNQCRKWLDKKQETACYRIHLLEEKLLKTLVIQYEELIERYFLNKIQRIFRNSFVDWITAGIFPDSERLHIYYMAIDPQSLKEEEIAFILTANMEKEHDVGFISDAELSDARQRFITQIIEILYSIAKPVEHTIWDSKEINLRKISQLSSGILPIQWKRLKTTSLYLAYDRNEIEYKGYYHWFFNEEKPAIEILFGQEVSTGTIRVEFNLIENGQEIPEIANQFISWLNQNRD